MLTKKQKTPCLLAATLDSSLPDFVAALSKFSSPRLLLATGFMVLQGLFENAGLMLLIPLLHVAGVDIGAGGGTSVQLQHWMSLVGLTPSLPLVITIYVLAIGVVSMLKLLQEMQCSRLQQGFAQWQRDQLYRSLIASSWAFFRKNKLSDITRVMTAEIQRTTAMTNQLMQMLSSGILAAIYAVSLFLAFPSLSAIAVVCGLSIVFALKWQNRVAHTNGTKAVEGLRLFYGAVMEQLSGLKTIRSFSLEQAQTEQFLSISAHLASRQIGADDIAGFGRLVFNLCSAITIAAAFYISFVYYHLSIASFAILLLILARLLPKISTVQQCYQIIQNLLPAYGAFDSLLCQSSAHRDGSMQEIGVAPIGDITLDNISFRYDDADGKRFAIHDITLVFPSKKTTVIVGKSGSGKSTVADLLAGIDSPLAGQIHVGGVVLNSTNLHAWRKQVGYVTQEPFFFHDTIRANLLWAKSDASEDELWQALRMASIDSFVTHCPEGLETIVGDRGVSLSGGERQRLALARVLLRNPQVLILDETLSALDPHHSSHIEQTIAKLHGTVTLVIISHRLQSAAYADQIVVMDHGNVVECGQWDTLRMLHGGYFSNMLRVRDAVVASPQVVVQ